MTIKAIINFLKSLIEVLSQVGQDSETPKPNASNKAVIGIIVGHTKAKGGAGLHGGGNEYGYNSDIARRCKEYADRDLKNLLTTHIIYRDGIGIRGAYKKATALKCDVVIELHFNAFNKKVAGTETLVATGEDNKTFGRFVHREICRVFDRNGDSRGVKVLSRSANGGLNVYSFPSGPNCLVEPFFGDNPDEAVQAQKVKQAYAAGLIEACIDYFEDRGIL